METNKDKIEGASYMYDEGTNKAWNELRSKIQVDEKDSSRILFTNSKSFFRVAATIVLFAALSIVGIILINSNKIIEKETFANEQTIEVLPDGTTVYLNTNSKIIFPKRFEKNKREITLKGEAFFEVTKDKNRPFIINVNEAQVEVLGTSFNILSNSSQKTVEVSVESGSVKFSSKLNNNNLILIKGETAILERNILNRKAISDINYMSWKTKLIDFRESPLDYVIKTINKTYASNIIIDNNLSSNLKLTAKFDQVPLDTIVESICLAFNFDYKKTGAKIHILNKQDTIEENSH